MDVALQRAPLCRGASLAGRIAVATLLTAMLLPTLAGCGSLSPAHIFWDSRISELPGVTDVRWTYENRWLGGGERYEADIRVSPEITIEEAAALGDALCDDPPWFSDMKIATGDVFEDGTRYAARDYVFDDCPAPGELARFGAVAEALEATAENDPSLIAEARASNFPADFEFDVRDRHSQHLTPLENGAQSLSIETTELSTLLTFLEERWARSNDAPLLFEGWVDDDGRTLTNFGTRMNLFLPAGYDLSNALELLEAAYMVNDSDFTLSPDGLEVSDALPAEDLAMLEALGSDAGIPVKVVLSE